MAVCTDNPSLSTLKSLPNLPCSRRASHNASNAAPSTPTLASIISSKSGPRDSQVPVRPFPPSHHSKLPSFTTLVTTSQTLSCLLSFLPWSDFMALSQICRTCRHIFSNENLRDVVLSRYVDGYGYVLRQKDPSFSTVNTVSVTLHDLDLLFISQSTPLHLYPTHALSILSSLLPTLPQHTTSQKLVRLVQAHSRFVLLIQSIAHSSSQPLPIESEPDLLVAGLTSDKRHLHARSSTSGSTTAAYNSRELQFPAPLSYSQGPYGASPERPSDLYRSAKSTESRGSSSALSSARSLTAPSSYQMSRTSTMRSSTIKKKNRLSVFGSRNSPFPQPSEPNALKYHSWRQTSQFDSHRRRTSSTKRASVHALSESWASEDSFFATFELGMNDLRKPTPWFAASRKYSSSDTSLGSGSSSASGGTPPSTAQSSVTSPSSGFVSPRSKLSHPSLASTSPHDLILATSRVRAPVLRVFVPCSQLSETFADLPGSAGSIEQCEDQLVAAGLWEHLSTGDIVCNLGYVPASVGHSSSGASEDEGESLTQGSRRPRSRPTETQKWLIFNGEVLVPFSPAEDRVPTGDPLCLPSPWYYEHIRSPLYLSLNTKSSQLASSQIVLDRLPPFPSEAPQMSLISYALNVKSPTSRGGVIKARKWVWVARIWRGGGVSAGGPPGAIGHPEGPKLEMGIGWQGEWILECEGTKEGRQTLIESIRGIGSQTRRWEFVREYSGGGRIWLRMVDAHNNDHPQKML